MEVRRFPPLRALERVLTSLTIVTTGSAEATRVLLPDAATKLAFRFAGGAELSGCRVPDATFTGLSMKARHMRTLPDSGVVVAALRPGGAAMLLRAPLHELHGAQVALADLWPASDVARAEAALRDATTDAARLAVVQSFLAARLLPRTPDLLVTAAVRALHASRGAVRVATLADTLRIGQDALEKRFRRAVGASPKQVASILRLRHAVSSHRPGESLTRLALESGYYDQAHFNRDLHAAVGTSPQRFFAAATHC